MFQYVKLYDREAYKKADKDSGNESGFAPQHGAPYGMRLEVARKWFGMPCWKPPFGELVALDIGGPAVTAGGVIFIGAPMDAKVRAYSLATAEELGSDQAQAQAPVVANPAVYEYKGREYVAFVAGGNTIHHAQCR